MRDDILGARSVSRTYAVRLSKDLQHYCTYVRRVLPSVTLTNLRKTIIVCDVPW